MLHNITMRYFSNYVIYKIIYCIILFILYIINLILNKMKYYWVKCYWNVMLLLYNFKGLLIAIFHASNVLLMYGKENNKI